MKKMARMPMLGGMLLLGLCLLLFSPYQTDGQVDDSQLPTGNWSFSAHPYFGSGYDSRPVVVIAVTASSTGGLVVNEVGLRNLSSKSVAAVKLRWYLSEERTPDTILLQGQTPLIAFSEPLPVGKRYLLKFPVLSFAKIHKPLLNSGSLTGDFYVQIEVGEILYEDGTTSSLQREDRLVLLRQLARLASPYKLPVPDKSVNTLPTPERILSVKPASMRNIAITERSPVVVCCVARGRRGQSESLTNQPCLTDFTNPQ
jgi:hypothetical protein